ncbi:MAG: cytidylate kinase-like family protein, partial [Spirochaetota bacterium]|nr:cytidylate kinase-like family protein [Spirochaetota bacterium]
MSDKSEWSKLSIDKKIGTQIEAWTGNPNEEKKPFITISREFGSEGWIIGQRVEEIINKENDFHPPWVAYNKEILNKLEENENLSKELVESLEKPAGGAINTFIDNFFRNKPVRISIFKKTARVIKALASNGHVIIVGRGGCFITHEMKNGFHVRIVAQMDWRIRNIMKQQNLSQSESEKLVKQMENERDAFIKDYFFTEVSDPHYYDLVINTSRFSIDEAA